MRTIAKVLKEGRVTLDKNLRDTLGIDHGDVVEVEVKSVEGEKV